MRMIFATQKHPKCLIIYIFEPYLMVPVNEPIQISPNRLHTKIFSIKTFVHRTLEFVILIKLAFQQHLQITK